VSGEGWVEGVEPEAKRAMDVEGVGGFETVCDGMEGRKGLDEEERLEV
jgi:hypothetical protein